MRRIFGVATPILLILLGADALACPPPEPAEPREHRPLLEWSTWARLAYGEHTAAADAAARATTPTPAPATRDRGVVGGLGADVTLPIDGRGDVRIGPWIEARTDSSAVIGGELLLGAMPRKLDMFLYQGEGVLILRGGGNRDVYTGAIAYGYRAPWRLWGPWPGATRYMIGVRLVASATRAVADRSMWSVNAGIEFEPVGALRYLLGIRSWY